VISSGFDLLWVWIDTLQEQEQRRAMYNAKNISSTNDSTIPPSDSPYHHLPQDAHSLYSNIHNAQLRYLVIRQSRSLQDAYGIHRIPSLLRQRLSYSCLLSHQVSPRPVGVKLVRRRPRFCVVQLLYVLHLQWSLLLGCGLGNMTLVLRWGGSLG
jgi:hypothetical protein